MNSFTSFAAVGCAVCVAWLFVMVILAVYDLFKMKGIICLGIIMFIACLSIMTLVMYMDLPVWMTNPTFVFGIGLSSMVFIFGGLFFDKDRVEKAISEDTRYDDFRTVVYKNTADENDRVWREFESGNTWGSSEPIDYDIIIYGAKK